MKNFKLFALFSLLAVVLTSCGDDRFQKSPVDNMIRDMSNVPSFTIILHDMDVDGTFAKTYKHQYKVITQKDSVPEEMVTDWYEVSKRYFMEHEKDMGMEIASKADGKVSKAVAPPGYSNYIGNPQYGHWTNRNGSSFWEFYGKYAFMSSMFNMFTYPVRRSYWDTYRGDYYGRGRPYYGPKTSGGGTYYGTYSDYNKKARPNSTWYSSKNQSFRNKVRNRVSRSSRSGSRYGGSSRSRGGGFGK